MQKSNNSNQVKPTGSSSQSIPDASSPHNEPISLKVVEIAGQLVEVKVYSPSYGERSPEITYPRYMVDRLTSLIAASDTTLWREAASIESVEQNIVPIRRSENFYKKRAERMKRTHNTDKDTK